MEIIYMAIILILLYITSELYRWMILYKKTTRSVEEQNKRFVKIHSELSNEFIEQFKKYETESVENRKLIDSYTKMYQGYLDLYQQNKK